MRRELTERKHDKSQELPEHAAETGVSNVLNHACGRPKLDIAINEVLRMLTEGELKSSIARLIGVHRQSIDPVIEQSPTARKLRGMRSG